MDIVKLTTLIRGEVILPEHRNYDEACKLYNGMINKKPAIIVKCVDVSDVRHCVNFGRENNLLTAIRGGGHNGAGLGSCDNGLVIDLSGIKFVKVNTKDNTVLVGGGNVWGEVDHATHSFGLAVPAGIISTTGVGGLTLGGGVGYLSKKYGLTIDNLLEVDMVLADGSFVTVNKTDHADLFWAIRGGGGNFGVATAFKFQAHPIKNVIGGPTFWPLERLDEIMEWYHQFIHDASEDLNGFISVMRVPVPPFPDFLKDQHICGIIWCYTGHPDDFEDVFSEVREKQPIFDHVGEIPYPSIQTLFDALMPPGLQWYWRADFFNEIPKAARDQHFKFGKEIPTVLSQMHLYPISGKASVPKDTDMAWAYRDAKYAGVIVGVDPEPQNAGMITDWCKSYYDALHPYSMGGAYSNFMMEEGPDRVKASFKHNYDRLSEIKQKYDPNNFFKVNQNIKPKS